MPPEAGEGEDSEGEEGGPGPPQIVFFLRLSFVILFPSVRHLSGTFSFVFPIGGWGPYYDQLGRSVAREKDIHI